MSIQMQSVRVGVWRADRHSRIERADVVAAEEPLEIQVNGEPYVVTMRTPGHDLDLALGFCLSEGLVARQEDLRSVHARGAGIVDVHLASPPKQSVTRASVATSACGVCGTASADLLPEPRPLPPNAAATRIEIDALCRLPDAVRGDQRIFARTGGCHAAALVTVDGRTLCVREDVGRHNAADKVIGWALRSGLLPAVDCALVLSGRSSYELVMKALAAGIPIVAAVSAPSSAAVNLATEHGLTLAGFVRDGSANIYACAERIVARAGTSAPGETNGGADASQ